MILVLFQLFKLRIDTAINATIFEVIENKIFY